MPCTFLGIPPWPQTQPQNFLILFDKSFIPLLGKRVGEFFEIRHKKISPTCILSTNLRRLHRSKKNHLKIIVIGQIIGSGKIDSFILWLSDRRDKSMHYPESPKVTEYPWVSVTLWPINSDIL